MNKHLFIPPTSCHPPHIFRGWVIGSGRRLRLNNQADNHYNSFITQFWSCLRQRGYKDKTIENNFSAISDRQIIPDAILNKSNQRKTATNVGTPFVVTYTPAIQASLNDIKKAIAITEEATLDPHFPMIFTASTTPLLSFKRDRNLRGLVASSALSQAVINTVRTCKPSVTATIRTMTTYQFTLTKRHPKMTTCQLTVTVLYYI